MEVERRHYVAGGEIAKGGMGRVIEARDLRLGREVAIKELLPKHRDAADRFEREARITARLQHPAIINIYEAGVWPGGEPFYAMTKVVGRSLDKVVAERVTLVERLGLLRNVIAVADAMAYAHSQHVIHRDLKPANVLVGEFGETVVIDWGLAIDLTASRDAAAGSVAGTPAYMPPEQARGEPVDARADVYALGALLYKVLAGVAPYTGASSDEVLAQVRRGPPEPLRVREPDAPPDLIAIVDQAMARDPAERYASAGELASDLQRFETGQLVAARHYTTRQLLTRWLRRHRVVVAVAAVAIVAIASIGVFSVRRIVDERERARSEERNARLGRIALLEERGRSELLAGHAGAALAYLMGAARDGAVGGARGFLIADAMRPFEAERAQLVTGAARPVIAVSPDGRHIATGGAGAVELFTPDGARERVVSTGVDAEVLAFDPQSARLAVASADRHVRVWSLEGALVADLAPSQDVLVLAFSPDGRTLVTAGAANSAQAWDVATGTGVAPSCPPADPPAPVLAASVSGDGTLVVTGRADGTACIWKLRGEAKTLLRGHAGAINSVRWNDDDSAVITASDDGTARAWSTARGKPVIAPLRHGNSSIELAQVSSDHRLVLTAGKDRTARIWELPATLADDGAEPTLRPLATLAGHIAPIDAVVFSADDELVATASADSTARVWDAATGQQIAAFEHGDAVLDVAFAAGGTRLVTASRDGTVRIWDTRVTEQRHELFASVNALAVAPDGTVVAGADDAVTLLHGDRKQVLQGHLGRVYAVAFAPGSNTMISAGEDPAPIVWNAATGAQLGTLPVTGPIHALAASPDGRIVAVATDAAIELVALAESRVIARLPVAHAAIAFDPRGDLLAGSDDGTLRRWTQTGEPLATKSVLGGPVRSLAIAADGAIAVAGTNEVRIVGDAPVVLDGVAGGTRAIVFSRDGQLVVTAGSDGIARVWDARKGKLVGTRATHARAITALAVDGDTLWIGGDDGVVGAWDIHSDRRTVDALDEFARDKHVPVRLGEDDVVRRISEVPR